MNYNYLNLINNFKINNAFNKHEFHKIALSNKSGESLIYFSKTNANIGGATLQFDRDMIVNKNSEKVILEKLDNLYKIKNQHIFMKVDIEGHEDKFVDGSLEILRNNKILMYLETTNEVLLKKLEKMKFKIYYPKFFADKVEFSNKQNSYDVILKNF